MAGASDVAESVGARDVAAWYAAETRQGHEAPRADQQLATSLDTNYPALRKALAAGLVNLAQARVIAAALDVLPADLDPVTKKRAEKALIGFAADHSPHQLRILGRRILEIVAPEIAEAEEARRLADEEAHARAKTKLALKPLRDGTTRISGILPNATAHRLKTYLEAFTNPRKQNAPTGATGTTGAFAGSYPRRLGQAFGQFLEVVDPKRLPIHAGDATTLIVTINLDQLKADLGTGQVIGGDKLTASEIRRLACTARILPAVLDGKSEILDLGRGSRLFEPPQRKAIVLQHETCQAKGCDQPASWCEVHHRESWATGGTTDRDNAVLLCCHHHHRAHDPTYTTDYHPNGDVTFTRNR